MRGGRQVWVPADIVIDMGVQLTFRPERELEELQAYLGDRWDPAAAIRFLELVDEELEELGDEDLLYRKSRAYLPNLTMFAITGTKLPYLRLLTSLVRPGSRLLDLGCGIGSDGLMLLEAGYEVTFADFDNPSVAYLRWRLRRRGLEARIVDLDQEEVPCGHDAAYAWDVLEHVAEPFELLATMESAADLVLVNLLEDEPGGSGLHRELPVAEIIDHASRRGLLRYRRWHGGVSHVLAYHGSPVQVGRPGSRLHLFGGRALSALQRRAGADRPGRRERESIARVAEQVARAGATEKRD